MLEKLFSSSFFRFLENIITVVTSLLLTPFLIATLGNESYGLWLLILSMLGWFNIIHLGFPSAVQRHITWALESKSTSGLNRIFSTSILLFLALGVIAIVGLFSLAVNPLILGISTANSEVFTLSLSLLCIKVLWDFVMCSFNGFFACLLRYDIDANISSLNAIVKAILVYYLLLDLNIYGAVIATLIADFLSNILKVIYIKRLLPSLSFNFKSASIKELKDLFHFSKHVIATGVAKTINSKVDPILVTKLFDLSLVPIFGIANRLAALVEGFTMSVSGVFLPMFNKMAANNQNMEDTFLKVTSINIMVYSTLYSILFVFSEIFVQLWVGKEFLQSIPILKVLIFSCICRAVFQSIRDLLFAQANHKYLSFVSMFGAIFNIILSIILAKQFGLIGIAISTSISFLLSDVVLSLLVVKKYNDFNIKPILQQLTLALVITYSVGLLGQYLIHQYVAITWSNLIIIGIIFTPLIMAINIFLLVDKETILKTYMKLKLKLFKPQG
jgi:O-antigen/teichoic acid export membrane protein